MTQRGRRTFPGWVNNSRFLILPWLSIKGLASHVLSLASRVVVDDWEEAYGVRPVLLETFVERERYEGTCYLAANWAEVGVTSGPGPDGPAQEKSRSGENMLGVSAGA